MASGEIDITPGRTLSPTELVDNFKLNDLGLPIARVKQAAITAREIADGSITSDKLDVNLEAQIGVADGSITTVKIVDDAVTAAKIADDLITAQAALLFPDAGDLFLVWDVSASALKKIDIANLLPAGSIVQSTKVNYKTYTTTTSSIPIDDTIPQIGEGTQLFTASITPRYATSLIRCRFSTGYSTTADFRTVIFSLFRDAVANAIGGVARFLGNGNDVQDIGFEVDDAPATTSAITYQIRFGINGGGTVAVNGWSGRQLGGIQSATLVLEEIKQ